MKVGGDTNELDQKQVYNAQGALLKDIILGCINGLTIEEIDSALIQPVLDELHVTEGALLAILHVINSAWDTLGLETIKKQPSMTTTTFIKSNVKIESFDYDTTNFRIIENNALISVRNDTHIRLVKDLTKITSTTYFEIIAPITVVKIIEGKIPQNCIREYSLSHYLSMRKYYIGE